MNTFRKLVGYQPVSVADFRPQPPPRQLTDAETALEMLDSLNHQLLKLNQADRDTLKSSTQMADMLSLLNVSAFNNLER